jgi:hypothetical protein
MSQLQQITAEELRELLDYNPDTGIFVRKATTSSRAQAGMAVGSDDLYGYLTVRINKKSYKLHRLAWLYMTGSMPIGDIDHINSDRKDNRFCNLRDTTRELNLQNQRRPTSQNRSTGVLGVYPDKHGRRFVAAISIGNKKKHIGTFDTEEQAHLAYVQQKRLLHAGCTI